MKGNRIYSSVLFSLAVLSLFPYSAVSAEEEPSEASKEVIALVDKAASAIESKGKDVFPEFRKKNGDWWKGELYVFVDGIDGTILVHPHDPTIEGQNLLKDPASRTIAKLMIDKAKSDGSGWVDYMWPKPGETTPSKKMSYIKKVKMPDGQIVIVGAGIYAK